MPWYKTGTVSVTQNSNAVIGAGTAFIANSRVGDGFRGPDGRWYEVTNIASNTALSISPNYEGPTAAGGFYSITPVQGYQKDLSDQVRAILTNYGEKLAALGTTGNYEVLPPDKGGTGGNSPATARAGLGLGSAATATLGNGTGNAMPVGAFGLGGEAPAFANIDALTTTEFKSIVNPAGTQPGFPYGTSLTISYNNATFSQLAMSILGNELAYRYYNSTTVGFSPWVKLYHTGNTTRGSGGALSAASPIVRIASVTDSQRSDLQEQTFEPAGSWGVANNEARGVSVERLDAGIYRVSGSLGLAVEGWRTQDPCSPDGGRTLGITESEQDTDGTVTIRLFKQRWTLSDDGEMLPGRGAPLDVPLNSWIDVRLEMPQPDYQPPPNDPVNE